jgi:adenine/guanine phosphoribosyltransferase-like PRPP-binding protein
VLRVLHSLLPERLKTVLKKNRAVKNLYYSAKPFMRSRYDFFTIQDLTTLTLQWVKTFPEQYDVIIGVPRSGMIVASIIACKLGKPLTTPDLMLQNKYWLPTRDKTIEIGNVRSALLVDDATGGGQTMQTYYHLLKDAFGNRVNIVKASLFVEKRSKDKVDLYYKLLTKNFFFEWNLAHATYGARLGVDMDGVLCDEPPVEVDMDEQRYVAWIKNARPNIIPTYTIEVIVTNRLEKYRTITEEWLKRHNVKYRHLIMLNIPSKRLRTPENMIGNKIKAVKQFDLRWFWESSWTEAQAIYKACRIPVLCMDKMVLFS